MKRFIKIIALCLCLAAFGVLFTGCDYLDEVKANHGVLSEDQQTISFRGNTYKRLPDSGELYVSYTYDYENSIDVTDSDVPVLLKGDYCYSSSYDNIKDLFCVWIAPENPIADENYDVYFCNEKDYDMYVKAINENKMDRIGFEYETYLNGSYEYRYVLDVAIESASKEILGYINNPEKLDSNVYFEVYNGQSSESLMCCLYQCDKDGVLAKPLDVYDIYRTNDGNSYLMNHYEQTAVQLSATTTVSLKNEYFYGFYDYDYDFGEYDTEVETMVLF